MNDNEWVHELYALLNKVILVENDLYYCYWKSTTVDNKWNKDLDDELDHAVVKIDEILPQIKKLQEKYRECGDISLSRPQIIDDTYGVEAGKINNI